MTLTALDSWSNTAQIIHQSPSRQNDARHLCTAYRHNIWHCRRLSSFVSGQSTCQRYVKVWNILVLSPIRIVDLGAGVAVHELAIDVVSEKVIPTPRGTLVVPSRPHESIEWVNNSAGDLRVLVDRKVCRVSKYITVD